MKSSWAAGTTWPARYVSSTTGTRCSDVASRDRHPPPVVVRGTPGLLPEFGFLGIDSRSASEGLNVRVAGETVLHDHAASRPGEFEVLYRAGFGSNGDWRLPRQFAQCPERRFVVGPEAHYPRESMFYTRAYQYYGANTAEYADDVILKCDDDIVYFDLDKLEAYVSFRRSRRRIFHGQRERRQQWRVRLLPTKVRRHSSGGRCIRAAAERSLRHAVERRRQGRTPTPLVPEIDLPDSPRRGATRSRGIRGSASTSSLSSAGILVLSPTSCSMTSMTSVTAFASERKNSIASSRSSSLPICRSGSRTQVWACRKSSAATTRSQNSSSQGGSERFPIMNSRAVRPSDRRRSRPTERRQCGVGLAGEFAAGTFATDSMARAPQRGVRRR